MTEIVGPLNLCMKYQETYTRSKVKCIKTETIHSITPQEEKISILATYTEDRDEEEEWVEDEEK
jgi:hypothetical protein